MIFNVGTGGGVKNAKDISYDNVTSGLDSTDIQGAIDEVNNSLVASDGRRLYFDSQDGKYGYNTDPSRGADTFVPFSKGKLSGLDISGSLTGSTSPHSEFFPATFICGNFKAIDSTTFAATEDMRVKCVMTFTCKGTSGANSHRGALVYNGTEVQQVYYGKNNITFNIDIEKDAPIRVFAYTVNSSSLPASVTMTMNNIAIR